MSRHRFNLQNIEIYKVFKIFCEGAYKSEYYLFIYLYILLIYVYAVQQMIETLP